MMNLEELTGSLNIATPLHNSHLHSTLSRRLSYWRSHFWSHGFPGGSAGSGRRGDPIIRRLAPTLRVTGLIFCQGHTFTAVVNPRQSVAKPPVAAGISDSDSAAGFPLIKCVQA